MPVIFESCFGIKDAETFDFPVLISGMSITVKPGDAYVRGVKYSFTEDQVWVAAPSDKARVVWASLIAERATGALHLLVDEVDADNLDALSLPDAASPYLMLYPFYRVNIPPNTVSLEGLQVIVYRMPLKPEV